MGTYNGARFLREQLDSISAQTHTQWNLLIRDDGSSDETVDIIEHAASTDKRIEIIHDENDNLGPALNFSMLCEAAKRRGFDYVFFSDQDDIWHRDKLALSLAEMRNAHTHARHDAPLLVHTDLAVVDENHNLIDSSFMHYSGFHHLDADPLRTLLVQNFVTGCSVACNRRLLEIAAPIPPAAVMHDYWFALCAAAFGYVLYLPQATLEYRQHAQNEVGARRRTMFPHAFALGPVQAWRNGLAWMQRRISQARALSDLSAHHAYTSREAQTAVEEFLAIFRARTRTGRLLRAMRSHVSCQRGLAHNALLYAQILCSRT